MLTNSKGTEVHAGNYCATSEFEESLVCRVKCKWSWTYLFKELGDVVYSIVDDEDGVVTLVAGLELLPREQLHLRLIFHLCGYLTSNWQPRWAGAGTGLPLSTTRHRDDSTNNKQGFVLDGSGWCVILCEISNTN